jgi:hypothetical protein
LRLPDVTTDQILNAMQNVPRERWSDALRAIEHLQDSPTAEATGSSGIRIGADLHDSPLIGIWSDRRDIPDRREFAREMHRQAEQRR